MPIIRYRNFVTQSGTLRTQGNRLRGSRLEERSKYNAVSPART